MVRLADLPEWDRRGKLEKVKELTGFDARPWVETAAGRVFLALHKLCLASPDKSLQQLCATSLVPRTVLAELSKS